ncbi:hypothetical protein VIGAN_04029400, partial [Vigna angularis var. angularis]
SVSFYDSFQVMCSLMFLCHSYSLKLVIALLLHSCPIFGKVSSHNQPMPCHCNKALIAYSCHLCNYVKPYHLSSGAYPIRAA